MNTQKNLMQLYETLREASDNKSEELDPAKCGELICKADKLGLFLSEENEVFGARTSFDRAIDMGLITLDCDALRVSGAAEFFEMISEAETIDVVPLPEGKLRLILTFTDLLKEAEDEE